MRVLIVDLNNFARYPTVGVGYLTAILRQQQIDVDVFSPLAYGVSGVEREPRLSLFSQHLRYRTAVSQSSMFRVMRHRMAARMRSQLLRESNHIAREFNRRIDADRPDIVLVSTYLMYYELCAMIGLACAERSVPALVGGSYFSDPEVANEWVNLEGIRGVVCGEIELELADILRATLSGESLESFPSIRTSSSRSDYVTPPFTDLDALPFPDYGDFPWDRYPIPIVPMVTGRGCGWGVCTFCSDITSTVHRTFRSRSKENVLREIEYQSNAHATSRFVFTDLMLNSNLDVWRGLIDGIQNAAPGAEWIAAVHVTDRDENGLDRDSLVAARKAGAVRLTTGIESGSPRVNKLMRKGTRIERTSKFLMEASAAGISVRGTLILGYPGEEAADVEATAGFLEKHLPHIERVQMNRFQIMVGTTFYKNLQSSPSEFPDITSLTISRRDAQADHRYSKVDVRAYRRAVGRLFRAVHEINRRPLRESARSFEGVM